MLTAEQFDEFMAVATRIAEALEYIASAIDEEPSEKDPYADDTDEVEGAALAAFRRDLDH